MRGVKRTDWDAASLFARWGSVGFVAAGGTRIVATQFRLPYPANKQPALEAHLARLGLHPTFRPLLGWARGQRGLPGTRYIRPQVCVLLRGADALRFFASINWRCGHERRDRAMAVWRTHYERPELGQLAL